MNTKVTLLAIWHGTLIAVILGVFIVCVFYPCLLETEKIQMEACHVESK